MFSVVIPYYKKRNYIERCLDSVLNQSFKNFEILVVDDGSKDDIVEFCQQKYGDKVNVISQENQGVSAARNKGISLAKNEYIAFLDADDYWNSYYLEMASQVILKENNVKIIGSQYSRMKEDISSDKPIMKYRVIEDYFSKQVFKNSLYFTSATIVSTHFFSKNSGFNSKIKRGEDLDVWFRAIASGGKVVYIENALVYYSDEDENQATNTMFDMKYSILSIIADEYIHHSKSDKLREFAPIFTRKRIYPYFFNDASRELSKNILIQIGYGNFFSNLLYRMPFRLGKVFSRTKLIKYYAKYLIK